MIAWDNKVECLGRLSDITGDREKHQRLWLGKMDDGTLLVASDEGNQQMTLHTVIQAGTEVVIEDKVFMLTCFEQGRDPAVSLHKTEIGAECEIVNHIRKMIPINKLPLEILFDSNEKTIECYYDTSSNHYYGQCYDLEEVSIQS